MWTKLTCKGDGVSDLYAPPMSLLIDIRRRLAEGSPIAQGQLGNRLAGLDAAIQALHDGLGPAWKETIVYADR